MEQINQVDGGKNELRANAASLPGALAQWCRWEVEYEEFREEVLQTENVQSLAEIQGSDDVLLDVKERHSLVLDSRRAIRPKAEIVQLIERRIDYVQQSIRSLGRDAQGQQNTDLPMMEIVEKLDEGGNMVSGSTVPGESGHEQILQVLQRAGVSDFEPEDDGKGSDGSEQRLDPTVDSRELPPGSPSFTNARIPEHEKKEDAALRRDMLAYNMKEVGAVVAELELETSDHDAEELDLDFSSDGSDEDDFGRSSHRVLTDDYFAEMRKLETKLNAKGIINVGHTSPLQTKDDLQPVSRPKKHSKGVRFAEELDIQEVPEKTARKQASAINANDVVERPFNPSATNKHPDELEPALVQRQVNEQYHRMRNRMIGQEGGFRDPNNRAQVSLEETGDYGGRRISRFRAARLGAR